MYVSSRTVLVFLLAMLFANSPSTAFARRGGRRPGGEGGRPGGKRPGGDRPEGGDLQGTQDFQRPPNDDFQGPQGGERPQGGKGPRPRGPPDVGVFAISSERPTLRGSIANSRGATIAPVNGFTAIYEGKLNDTSTAPTARRALLHDGVPKDIVFFSSTSTDGTTWSPGTLLTIANLPEGLIARKPTLSADGSLLFFVGSTGDLKSSPSAIHVAKCQAATSCAYSGVAFAQDGKIMSGCAYANGKLIVPNAGDMRVDDSPDSPTDPIPVARKLLDDKKRRGSGDGKDFAREAWVADCDAQGACNSAVSMITMPDPDADAMGRGPSAWRGSMIFANNQYQFYGSGKGNWPVVSSNGGDWTRVAADQAVDIPGPDPSCADKDGTVLCAAPMKRDKRKGSQSDDTQSQPQDLL